MYSIIKRLAASFGTFGASLSKLFFSLACLLPTLLMAKMPAVADTVWVDDEMDVVKRAKATRYGIVQDMDTVNNIVTIQFFEPGTERKDIIRRLALKEKEGRVRSRLLSETLLYPDGAILEELVFTTPEGEDGKAHRTYDRKLFYPQRKPAIRGETERERGT